MKKFISLIILLAAFCALCACGKQTPGLYEEKKCFGYDMFFLEMSPEGVFHINDVMCRLAMPYSIGGKYELYDSKLVLKGYDPDIELVFTKEDDAWVLNLKKSRTTERIHFLCVDQSVWHPANLYFFFKD